MCHGSVSSIENGSSKRRRTGYGFWIYFFEIITSPQTLASLSTCNTEVLSRGRRDGRCTDNNQHRQTTVNTIEKHAATHTTTDASHNTS